VPVTPGTSGFFTVAESREVIAVKKIIKNRAQGFMILLFLFPIFRLFSPLEISAFKVPDFAYF